MSDLEQRASGKTLRLALSALSRASSNPGERVALEDHHCSQDANRQLSRLAQRIAASFPCAKQMQFEVDRNGLYWLTFNLNINA